MDATEGQPPLPSLQQSTEAIPIADVFTRALQSWDPQRRNTAECFFAIAKYRVEPGSDLCIEDPDFAEERYRRSTPTADDPIDPSRGHTFHEIVEQATNMPDARRMLQRIQSFMIEGTLTSSSRYGRTRFITRDTANRRRARMRVQSSGQGRSSMQNQNQQRGSRRVTETFQSMRNLQATTPTALDVEHPPNTIDAELLPPALQAGLGASEGQIGQEAIEGLLSPLHEAANEDEAMLENSAIMPADTDMGSHDEIESGREEQPSTRSPRPSRSHETRNADTAFMSSPASIEDLTLSASNTRQNVAPPRPQIERQFTRNGGHFENLARTSSNTVEVDPHWATELGMRSVPGYTQLDGPDIDPVDATSAGACLHCLREDGIDGQNGQECPYRGYYYGLFILLSTSSVANVLRGSISDSDCEPFVQQLSSISHWGWAFQKSHHTWRNGLLMTLLYFWILCQTQRHEPGLAVEQAIICVSEVFGRHSTLTEYLLGYLRVHNLQRITHQLIGHISSINFPPDTALGRAVQWCRLPWEDTILGPAERSCPAWNSFTESTYAHSFANFCVYKTPVLPLERLFATTCASHQNHNSTDDSPDSYDRHQILTSLCEDAGHSAQSLRFLHFICKLFSAGTPLYVKCMREGQNLEEHLRNAISDATEAVRGRMRAPFILLIPGCPCRPSISTPQATDEEDDFVNFNLCVEN